MKKFNQFREDSLLEVLKASDPTGKWIHDFVHSDNPKFAGKSKKERIRMALGAAYAAKRNEEIAVENSSSEINEGHYEDAESFMSKANDADAKGDKMAFHHHMADYHDSLSQWHESKGRSASADKHAEKADYHSDKYEQLANGVKEDVVAEGLTENDIMSVADTYKKLAVKHMKDQHKATNDKQRNYASMMHKRSLEAAKMDNHTDALNHYRGVKEDVVAEARMSAAQRLWNAENKQRAKSDASLARTPSSIPKPEEKK